MSVIVVAEHNNESPRPSTLSTITAARQFNQNIRVLVAGFQCEAVAKNLSNIEGVNEVLYADHADYEHPLAERLTPLILQCWNSATHLLAPATTFGKNLMPRVAGKLGVAQVSDVTAILDERTYQRPIYAGNAIATVRSEDPIQVITVRTTAFPAAEIAQHAAKITPVNFAAENQQSRFIRQELHGADRPELTSADIVISGGRGLQTKENFERLMKIAEHMGAAMGASRAAVDAGLAPNDFQVGQTGQVVAPKLYFAVGISGAIQHLAGMKDSKIIVAINKDPDAPIFQIADYGLVADINDVLPQWEGVLSSLR